MWAAVTPKPSPTSNSGSAENSAPLDVEGGDKTSKHCAYTVQLIVSRIKIDNRWKVVVVNDIL
jgi:hypothetical protein